MEVGRNVHKEMVIYIQNNNKFEIVEIVGQTKRVFHIFVLNKHHITLDNSSKLLYTVIKKWGNDIDENYY